MPTKSRIRNKRRSVLAGEMDKRIRLHARAIKEPVEGQVDFSEVFDSAKSVSVWAMVSTATGKTLFDGVATDVNITHIFHIRFREDVSSETWIEYNGQYYKIVHPENLEERNQFLKISATIRGATEDGAAQA